jgi:hypothetical protein
MIKNIFRFGLAGISLALAACGGGDEGGIGGSGAPMGTLRMSITDAPSCGYDSVNITVDRVRVNKSATAGDSDAGWVDIVVDPPARMDLLTLTNGVLLTLGETPLETGTYTQMRLVLAENDSANPLANSVVPTGGSEVPLTTPSAQQSGLKSSVDIPVAQNQLADFVIDFDACKSVVSAGNSGKYILKPVIDVVPNYISGVEGFVDLSIAGGQTTVSLEQAGIVARSTVTDISGKFVLEPVAPGTYDLVVSAPGRATAIVRNVVVADGLVTDVTQASANIDPPASAFGTIAGAVSMTGTPIDAFVEADQALSDGASIDVLGLPADSVTGAYSMTLPTAAPSVANWVSGSALVFAADTAAAGQYALTATSPTGSESSGPLSLAAGATLAVDFTLP